MTGRTVRATLHRDLGPGVHGVEHAHTNCYVVEGDDGVTLVDAGFRGTGSAVLDLLRLLGRTPAEVAALLLTHGHFDHVGFAPAVQRAGVPVWVHGDDRQLAAHPYRYRPERNRLLYPTVHGRSWPILGRMVLAGALRSRGVRADQTFADGEVLDLPGRPTVLHTPGHTAGQCVLWLADRGVLLSGDALVTLDPYTGATGPRLVAPAATADSAQALTSLLRLADLDAGIVLPGHGTAWREGVGEAVRLARRAQPEAGSVTGGR